MPNAMERTIGDWIQVGKHCSIAAFLQCRLFRQIRTSRSIGTALGKCLEAGNATQEIPSDQIFRRSHRSHVARVWSTPRKHSLVQSQESRHQKTKTSGCGLTAAALDTACCARWTPPRVAPASKASRRSLGSHALTPGQFERVQHALQASHKRRCKGSSCRGPSAPSTRAVGQVSQKEHLQSDRRFDPRVKHTFP